jgi:hypothetical protein
VVSASSAAKVRAVAPYTWRGRPSIAEVQCHPNQPGVAEAAAVPTSVFALAHWFEPAYGML